MLATRMRMAASGLAVPGGGDPYHELVLADGPAYGYWRLEEAAGAQIFSSEISGTPSLSSPTAIAGEPGLVGDGSCVALDGTDGLETSAFSGGGGSLPFTAEMLFRSGPPTGYQILLNHATPGGNSSGWYVYINLGLQLFRMYALRGAYNFHDVPAALSAGTIYHLAITWDGTSMRLHLDGADIGGFDPAGFSSANEKFQVGERGTASRFTGDVDEVAYYDYALTPARIADHAQAAGVPA